MDDSDVSSDHVLAELVEMGFELPDAVEALKSVGPVLQDAINFILDASAQRSSSSATDNKGQGSNEFSKSQKPLSWRRRVPCHTANHIKQATILQQFKLPMSRDHLSCADPACSPNLHFSQCGLESNSSVLSLDHRTCQPTKIFPDEEHFHASACQNSSQEIKSDGQQNVNHVLQKHFGFSALKNFQKEALNAWQENCDCLVLAATGSGKSLCFQVPALLSGRVVVVISPLISLMRDQCFKLARYGISACFLGSGQCDSTVENKAMSGLYAIIYVCPETLLRLIEPLQRLAENRGIALFAIDEVHCISKWGHDFRPDYRRLSVLRECFSAKKLSFLKDEIPLMALTATATVRVREDIMESLHMAEHAKIVVTSFFRPNLRFMVKHSRTSCVSSYDSDFCKLIDAYCSASKQCGKLPHSEIVSGGSTVSGIDMLDELEGHLNSTETSSYDGDNGPEARSVDELHDVSTNERSLSVDFLEDEFDACQESNDLDVSCGEFDDFMSSGIADSYQSWGKTSSSVGAEEKSCSSKDSLSSGPTIIYVPSRKETTRLASYLRKFGVKASAYHAKMPKGHLRRVHEEFHQDMLQVIVATVAFGMGIDKSNVRRIIHYGWPQSLEAYYQEAGRAGRDGKLSECTLYADLSRIPTLLPSQRTEEQTRNAYVMLSDCFRYGMATASCRAKILVNYFGEEFDKCILCDVCDSGPPRIQDLTAEAQAFIHVLAAMLDTADCGGVLPDHMINDEARGGSFTTTLTFRMIVSKIREQFPGFAAVDRLWWQGLARILEERGYIRERGSTGYVAIKFPEVTKSGLKFLSDRGSLSEYPQADMLLASQKHKQYSSFAEWGRGWADPQIRKQRLERKRATRKMRRQKHSRKRARISAAVRQRINAKISRKKH